MFEKEMIRTYAELKMRVCREKIEKLTSEVNKQLYEMVLNGGEYTVIYTGIKYPCETHNIISSVTPVQDILYENFEWKTIVEELIKSKWNVLFSVGTNHEIVLGVRCKK